MAKVIEGDVNLDYLYLKDIPDILNGVVIDGYLYLNYNKLTSLKNCPIRVGGKFEISKNKITSLIGAPEYVGSDFDCYHNLLTTLEGCTQQIGGEFVCSRNRLISFLELFTEIFFAVTII